jgi:hypothetical protein
MNDFVKMHVINRVKKETCLSVTGILLEHGLLTAIQLVMEFQQL